MNKMKLLMLLFMTATGMTVSAADAGYTFVESDGGNTLTIQGYGDLTNCSQTDTKTVFSAAAAGNVFTDNNGTSVVSQAIYNPSATYYIAESGYTQLFNGGAPEGNTYVYDVATSPAWSEAAEQVHIYEVLYNWKNELEIQGTEITVASSSPNSGYLTNSFNYASGQASPGQYVNFYIYSTSAIASGTELVLGTNCNYVNSDLVSYTTTYRVGNAAPLYRSQDGGATKQQLTVEQQYTYNAGDLFYTASGNVTYTQIADNAAFFAANPSYLEDAEVTATFKDALLAKINSGAYTKVEFVNSGSGELTINPEIVQKINFPNNSQNTNLTNLDLGQTTLKLTGGEKFSDIFENPGANYSYSNTLAEVTLPLVAADADENVILPSNVIPSGYNDAKAALKTVKIPEGYTEIGDRAFYGNSGITTVNMPSTLTEIGDEAFLKCGSLQYINNTASRSIVFPSSLETIGKSAFEGCNALTSTAEDPFILPSGLKTVKASAFINLTNLKFLQLNEGLEYVGNTAFGLSSELHDQTTITFPSTIKYLGPGSFISRWYQDIYFTGETAPVCPVGACNFDDWGNVTAFSANTQMGNNGFNPAETDGSTSDNANEGYANRENYVGSGGYYFTILHFPNGLTADQAKTYRDITRRYVTANGSQWDTSGDTFRYGGSIANIIDPTTGETFGSVFKEGTTNEKSNLVYYMSSSGLLDNSANADNLQPGFIDTYRGEQQVWPSQMQWTRNFVTVANGVEWDGVTEYRPVLTEEMFNMMKEDGLFVKANSLDYTEGAARISDSNNSSGVGKELSLAEKAFSTLTDVEKDYLSLILYQGTRRFVLSNDSQYEIPFKLEMEAGRWWSICLPFNMTKKQVDEIFGVGTHVCLFSGVVRTSDTDGKLLRLEFINDVYHHKTDRTVSQSGNALKYTYGANYSKTSGAPADDDIVIYARESYMIYPTMESDDASGVAVRNFGIPEFTIGDPLPTMIQANSETPYTVDGSDVAYRFIGNFNANAGYDKETGQFVTVKVPRYSYVYGTLWGETKFWIMNTDKVAWAPFKSIVQSVGHDFGLNDWTNFFQKNSAAVKQVTIFGLEEDVTGVEKVIIEASSDNGADKAIYNLNGSLAGDSLQGLAPGVYVQQGKAYIVQ